MTEYIDPSTFSHLVNLAALELSPDEAVYLRQQLNAQLKAVHELEAIPLEGNEPITSHGVPYTPKSTPPMRTDAWQPDPDPARIISQAPESGDGYIIVPDIPHTTLE